MKPFHLCASVLALALTGLAPAYGQGPSIKGKWVITFDQSTGKPLMEEIDILSVKAGAVKGKSGKKDLEGELKGTILTLTGAKQDFQVYLDGGEVAKFGLGVGVQFYRKGAKIDKKAKEAPPNPELIFELIDMEYSQGKTVFTVTSLKKDGTAKGTLGSSSTTAWGGRLAANVLTFTADFGKIKRDFTVIFAKDGEEWKMKMRITSPAGQ